MNKYALGQKRQKNTNPNIQVNRFYWMLGIWKHIHL